MSERNFVICTAKDGKNCPFCKMIEGFDFAKFEIELLAKHPELQEEYDLRGNSPTK